MKLLLLRSKLSRIIFAVATSTLLANGLGCTSAEESEIVTSLQSALSSLQQNKSLAEQFVRDVKSGVTPSDPAYAEVMESYQNARTTYDRYLDSVEEPEKTLPVRSLRRASSIDVQNAAADFLADATSALKPSLNTRRIPFQRAVIVPDNLGETLHKLPKKSRSKLIDHFDEQLRWRSWSQL